MESFLSYSAFSDFFNAVFDIVAVIAFWVWLAWTIIRYTWNKIDKEGAGRGIYLGIVACVEAAILIYFIFSSLPQFLIFISQNTLEPTTIYLIIIYYLVLIWSYYVSYKNSQWRGVLFVSIILITVLFGWIYNRWFGIFFMSVPVLMICLYVIYRLAQVILPASDPEDKSETWNKARVFLAYLFGVQHPIWMAEAKTGRNIEKQIDGSANQIGKPGIIWTWSHQTAGISKGSGAHRAAGPGLIFTEPHESPIALVDLRMQSRVCTVNTVTKDGIEIPTIVFGAFAIDKRDSSISRPSRPRPAHRGSFNIDHIEGSFPYSSDRVLAALSNISVNNPRRGETKDMQELVWDEYVIKQIEHATRMAVAERSLDELWRPKHDDRGASALNEIAADLQGFLAPQLAEAGINLITVRIVNFIIPLDHPIVKQNLNIWRSYWERKIAEADADIEMIYRDEIEKAHAYSKSLLLSAIADSIKKAHTIDAALPRHMIAQYFIHALDEYIKGQPGLNIAESKKRLDTVKEILINNRLEGNE